MIALERDKSENNIPETCPPSKFYGNMFSHLCVILLTN